MARQTIEHKINEYFQTAPLAAVNVLYGIVRGTMQTRIAIGDPNTAAAAPKRRRRSKKAMAAAAAPGAEPVKRRGRKPKALHFVVAPEQQTAAGDPANLAATDGAQGDVAPMEGATV